MTSPVISKVSTSATPCPVVDFISGTRKCYFQREPWVLYSKGPSQSTDAIPIALLDGHASLSVELDLTGSPSEKTFEFTVLFRDSLGQTQPLTEAQRVHVLSSAGMKAVSRDLSLLAPTVQNVKKAVPWAFVGTISVQAKEIPTAGSRVVPPAIASVGIKVEIFVLSASLPDLYLSTGIPRALLKLDTLLPMWMKSQMVDWPIFVVQAIFNDPRLEYHVFNGISKYTSWEGTRAKDIPDGGLTIDCWLDLWLSDMVGSMTHRAKLFER
jgi:hypothetical protein